MFGVTSANHQGTGKFVTLYEDILSGLKKRVPVKAHLAKKARIKNDQVSGFYAGRNTGIKDVAAMLEAMGARVVWPDEQKDTTREICFIDAKMVGVENGAPPPPAENYFAVPLAKGPVAAGPGLVPEDEVKGWLLVYRYQKAVQYRTNLVAVEIGQGQESMAPTLHPEDIVLVDKDVRSPEPEGSIFLVRDPDGDVTIKRVTVERRKPGETWLAFSSDNPDKRAYLPRFYSLEEDYGGDITKVIVGRVVWAWKDMTRK